MTTATAVPATRRGLSVPRAALVALPMLLLSAFMLTGGRGLPRHPLELVPFLLTFVGVNVLFFRMARTGRTDRYRAVVFVALAVAFVLTFIPNLIETRGAMGLTQEDMIRGRTPFCHMVIPMTIVPAALTRTIVFPGTIQGGFADVSTMFVIWIGATIVLGRGFCAWGCFFGGIEDGLSRLRRRAVVRRIADRWTYLPYAVLAGIVVTAAVSLSPTYCMWLCPFKTVSEYVAVIDFKTALQAAIFLSLFFGLVVVLPILSRKRTQCGLFCPMGAFQGFFNKTNLFEVRLHAGQCTDCDRCVRVCPTFSIDAASVAKGRTRLSCCKCGRCVDECPTGAATFHVKGTPIVPRDERARWLFLYPAFLFLVTFGGGMIQGGIYRLLLLATTGSILR
jgi:ferredoxin-type protein NapH